MTTYIFITDDRYGSFDGSAPIEDVQASLNDLMTQYSQVTGENHQVLLTVDAWGNVIDEIAGNRIGEVDQTRTAASALGSVKSTRKAAASRENGKLGGRPRKQ